MHAKQSRGKTQYYLRKAEKGSTKDVAYLGSDLKEVVVRLRQHSKEAKKSYRTITRFLERRFARERVQGQAQRIPLLDDERSEEILACKVHVQESETAPVEQMQRWIIRWLGENQEVCSAMQIRRLVREGRSPGNKSVEEVMTALRLVKAARLCWEGANLEECFAALTGKEEWPKLPRGLDASHPFVEAARILQAIEQTKPFSEKNEIMASLAASRILRREGFPPLVLRKNRRGALLVACSKAELGPLARLLADEYVEQYWKTAV